MEFFYHQDFPVLSKPVDWGIVRARLSLSKPIDEDLISNVTINH